MIGLVVSGLSRACKGWTIADGWLQSMGISLTPRDSRLSVARNAYGVRLEGELKKSQGCRKITMTQSYEVR
jgi:hypothetical protein